MKEDYQDTDYLKSVEIHGVKNQEFDFEKTLETLKETEGVILRHVDPEKQRILAEIEHYGASVRVGSRNWCISSVVYGGSLGMANGINYWNSYKGHHPNRTQFFVWDFNQPREWLLVGTTTDDDKGNFYCAYNYPNLAFSMENYIQENNWDRKMFFDADN